MKDDRVFVVGVKGYREEYFWNVRVGFYYGNEAFTYVTAYDIGTEEELQEGIFRGLHEIKNGEFSVKDDTGFLEWITSPDMIKTLANSAEKMKVTDKNHLSLTERVLRI